MFDMEKSKRKVWTEAETLLFLKCYNKRKDEFLHARKKKFAYENVLEDMIFQGFTDTTVNVAALVAKMRTLLKAYNTAKDKQTGTSPCTIPYMSEMDEIFGESRLVSDNHSINIGTDPLETLIESSVNQLLKVSTDFEAMFDDMSSTSRQSRSALNRSMCTPTEVYPQEPNTANANPYSRYRESTKERYFEGKIELKRKRAEEKAKFYANIQSKMQDLVEKRNLHIEIEQKKLNLEEEKLKLLQLYVMNKR
ncbi:uncharacterized protein LOC105231343 [Bactrocera dorsalis]|uniref:Uncharacterized protein LOC105231343 n=1 Tax=Bactrocera dorsalis TaxID=27457 RepID=A0A6I9VDI0_BACDO|nr:uncharacterized protein LOC105231343 [Bactrocera dorsalis]